VNDEASAVRRWTPASGAAKRLASGRAWLPQPQSIQAVFFDVGYTLLDPYPSVPVVVHETLKQHGISVELGQLEAALPSAEALFERLARASPHAWGDEQMISGIWRQYFSELLRPCVNLSGADLTAAADLAASAFERGASYAPYPDVQPSLRSLSEHGLKLGVVSDWGLALSAILRHHELTRYFNFTVISALTRRAKPDPALFQLALDRGDAIPDYTLYIGDSYIRDALGARAVGITPVLIDRAQRLDQAALDCPLVYDLYEALDLLEIARPAHDGSDAH
jgi:putative hydrolase of the HAD superfamily